MGQSDFLGKKIFFLYPQSVIQDEMLDILIMSGFESYASCDPQRSRSLLAHFPGSIMFINIDEGMPEEKWEAYIREIQEDPKTQGSRLGILSYNTNPVLMEKYLMGLSLPCGYIQLKLGLQASTKIILSALEANEARGCRKYIRAFCEDDQASTMNFKTPEGALYYGKILDISSAGIAVRFDKPMDLPVNAKIPGIQLRLRSSLIMTDGTVAGKRSDESGVWIILLNPSMKTHDKLTIHHYIKSRLQISMDRLKI
ncbi:MAG: PilZ domain-containing protein [Spirochaetaceae bacterium]|jgi:hypothetical protein|nr:PilZ domain-containing protein [Spirochaetaceae bacterium]